MVKELIRKAGMYFLQTHLFISCTAVAMAVESCILLQQRLPDPYLLLFIFFATHFTYNVYYVKGNDPRRFRVLAFISLIISGVLLFFVPPIYYPALLVIALASSIYIFPVFFSFYKGKTFTFQKLLLLIFIWVMATFILPMPGISYTTQSIVCLLYRILFLSVTCLVFFIRDEKNESLKKKAIPAVYLLLFLQFINAVLVSYYVHFTAGLVLCLITGLTFFLTVSFLNRSYNHSRYLFFVDGVLLLEAAVIISLYYLAFI